MAKALWFVWKSFLGAALCQFPLTSILAVGWSYRLTQRMAVKRWHKLSEAGGDFRSYARAHEGMETLERFPNWALSQKVRASRARDLQDNPGLAAKAGVLGRGLAGSLGANAVTGLQGIANTFVLTLAPAMLWQFGWYAGWDNSFNKGYEQYGVGIALSWTGILLFIAAMLYVPMAQARQAVSGNWRTFYEFRLVWTLVRSRWPQCLLLAVCFSLLSLPITLAKVLPFFIQHGPVAVEDLTAAEALKKLNDVYFLACLGGFFSYAALRVLAGRIYAGAIVDGLRAGFVSDEALAEKERGWLAQLGFVPVPARDRLRPVAKILRWTIRPAWRTGLAAATALVWFSFVAQIYVSEFLVYHPVRGFMNQSLVHLPWFRYVPAGLERDAKENSPRRPASPSGRDPETRPPMANQE